MKALTIREASNWATEVFEKIVTESNISYLVQYGRIEKIIDNGETKVLLPELEKYYREKNIAQKTSWLASNGDSVNWDLSFQKYSEAQTTKHVHRLHPYKGKFIPQLVEYFLDEHTDTYKKEVYFRKGDIVLDPFCGSGTTLVQANELGINAIGVDVSQFNAMISNCKIDKHDLAGLQGRINKINELLIEDPKVIAFDSELKDALASYNQKYFPSARFAKAVIEKRVDEKKYGKEKEEIFLETYKNIAKKHGFDYALSENGSFVEKWFFKSIRSEIEIIKNFIQNEQNEQIKKALTIVLTRTMRSCRATTHADLATLLKPITTSYYCSKHKKICKPLYSLKKWWTEYSIDTVTRLKSFDCQRTETLQKCFIGNSKTIDLEAEMRDAGGDLFDLYKRQKIKGIFTSPPYVGMIDYHEQHAYAYDVFNLARQDEAEIGPLRKGNGRAARDSYAEGIAAVLNNCKKYLADDFEIFLVANDKFNLYPIIAEKANLTIVEKHHRPVLNRTEKDKSAYSETIFRLKEKK